jgi:hypothetical protein
VTDHLAARFVLLPCGHFVNDEDTIEIVATLRFIRDHAGPIQDRIQCSGKTRESRP